jgi:hypothetical protein
MISSIEKPELIPIDDKDYNTYCLNSTSGNNYSPNCLAASFALVYEVFCKFLISLRYSFFPSNLEIIIF